MENKRVKITEEAVFIETRARWDIKQAYITNDI